MKMTENFGKKIGILGCQNAGFQHIKYNIRQKLVFPEFGFTCQLLLRFFKKISNFSEVYSELESKVCNSSVKNCFLYVQKNILNQQIFKKHWWFFAEFKLHFLHLEPNIFGKVVKIYLSGEIIRLEKSFGRNL